MARWDGSRRWALGGSALLAALAGATAPACFAGGAPIDPIVGDEDAGIVLPDAGPDALGDAPPVAPHAVVGATPSHGPFVGGQRVLVRGNGFTTGIRVWFGDVEATDVIPVDATRVQVVAPPGAPGPVDLSTQNGEDASTRRTLPAGYVYDPLHVAPATGPIGGGTALTIQGAGTGWNASTAVLIDGNACEDLEVLGSEELRCVTPPGTPGAKTVRTLTGDQTLSVLEAFTYEDSSNGYQGGLSGDPLDGELRVLVYGNYTGDAIPGAHVIVGPNEGQTLTGQADETGVALFTDPALDAPRTVTVAATCHEPITFVDVPVDTVTVYLDPLLVPACGDLGDPPPVGGKAGASGRIRGELVWQGGVEFERAPWNVPPVTGETERIAAYVLPVASSPTANFQLPGAGSAITPADDGSIGYAFTLTASPGNRTLYAVAGIEDRDASPPRFTAYSMGVVKGVPVIGGQTTSEVFVMMQPLELALSLDASPPAPGPKGPDRLAASVAVRLGNDGFALIPGGQLAPPLPLSGDVQFVGLPFLGGAFAGASYAVTARAVTGSTSGTPLSVVAGVQATDTSAPVVIGDFVGIPTVVTPALDAPWDGRTLTSAFGPGAPIDLSVYELAFAGGLLTWRVAVPGGARTVELPDLSGLEGATLPSGPMVVSLYGARIDDFDYGALRYRNLRPGGMTAHSLDTQNALLP